MIRFQRNIKSFLRIALSLTVLLGLFFAMLRYFSPDTIEFPTVIEIYSDFFASLLDFEVLKAIGTTAKYVLLSVFLSIILGTALSFVLNFNKRIWLIVEPTIDFLRSVPITFFIPAFAVILGVSSPNIIWILAIIPSTLIILVNVASGIKELENADKQNRRHHYQLLSGKNSKWELFWKVQIFEILPHFISGFRVSLSYAIVIVTVLEYMQMGNQIGLGRLVYDAMENLNYTRVYSIIIIVGLIGYLLNVGIQNIKEIYKIFISIIKPTKNEN